MRVVESTIKDWHVGDNGQFITPEGFVLEDKKVKAKVCKFNSVPETLINVDDRFGTTTAMDVLKKAAKKPSQFLVDDEGKVLSVLDPRNKFMSDSDYENVVTVFDSMGLTDHMEDPKVWDGVTRRTIFKMSAVEKHDKFVDDLFHRELIFERKNDGGVYLGIGLLRLACTNGMLVPEGQFRKIIRSAKVDEEMCKFFKAEAESFLIDKYMHDLFFDGDRPYMASVENYLAMRDTLKKATDEDIASLYYPLDPIVEHYSSQGIDVTSTPRRILSHLPSGLEYYKCFNILTNGVKKAEELDLAREIEVGRYASASQMRFVRAEDIHFEGMPHFSDTTVHHLMGDKS